MQVEYKLWKAAEAKADAARAAERIAYAKFRENLNKKPQWRNAQWDIVLADEAAEKAFEAYMNA